MVDYGKDVISEPIRIFDQTEDIPSSFRIIDAESILHLAINAKAHLTFRFYRTCRREFRFPPGAVYHSGGFAI